MPCTPEPTCTRRIILASAIARACSEACGCRNPAGRTVGGNRQANAALYRAVIVRMRWHQPTIDYVTRRTKEGLSKREIISCLKRYLAREIYLLLPAANAPRNPNQSPNRVAIYRSINALAEAVNGLYKTELIRQRGPWPGLRKPRKTLGTKPSAIHLLVQDLHVRIIDAATGAERIP